MIKNKKVLYYLIVGVLVFGLMEVASYIILRYRGYVGSIFNERAPYLNRMNFWSGGLDNQEGYFYVGYNDSLKLGDTTYINQYGMIHGDNREFCISKGSNVVRVVLTGGSGLFGSLQTWNLIKKFGYPQGSYDYKTSIAGKLKSNLEQRYPQFEWEVINAGVVMHLFAQSYGRYFEKIKQLNPDIIINMDGYNDYYSIFNIKHHGDPHLSNTNQIEKLLRVEFLKWNRNLGFTYLLINLTLNDLVKFNIYDIVIGFFKKYALSETTSSLVLNPNCEESYDVQQRNMEGFECVQPILKNNMKKQLWLIDSYTHQLKRDSIFSIFCYQPILQRKINQKVLSQQELEIYQHFKYDEPNDVLNALPEREYNQVKECLGDKRYDLIKYYNEVFFNEYVVRETLGILDRNGAYFIDLGEKMKTIGADKEFYMDYTHTTPFGNQFIADEMVKGVEYYLQHR